MIKVKRVYESPESSDGARFLVDRLWPRGLKRDRLQLSNWLKEVAPENALRHWFNHDPAKWDEFQHRYFADLDKKPDTWQPILNAARQGDVTLLFAARAVEHNNAVALKIYLDKKMGHTSQ
ncbi:MAG: DUF488 family protein [Anaerolineae bacterium]|nr:DUF488 family protein [Anaerolineae bacterium]